MQKKKKDFVGIILIIFAMCIISYVTFAWLTYSLKGESTLNFSKIELDSTIPTINISKELNNLLPNEKIIDDVSFKKSFNSESFFVRANAHFSCDIDSEDSNNYIKVLNDDIKNYVSTSWYFYNDYFYLINGTNLKEINDDNKYTFIQNYMTSKNLQQWDNVSQYGVVFNFNVKFNVIQSKNVGLSSLQDEINFFENNFKDNLSTTNNQISCTIKRDGIDTQSDLVIGNTLSNSLSLTDKNIVIVNNSQIDNNKVIDESLSGKIIEIYEYTDESYFDCDQVSLNGQSIYEIILNKSFSGDVLVLPNKVNGNVCTFIKGSYIDSNSNEIYPFNKLNIKTLIIPNGYVKVEAYAFKDNSNLEKVYFSNTLDNLDVYCFNNCPKLNGIVIPDSVSIIASRAFLDCSSLSSVIFNKTQLLKSYSFYGTKLESVIIPKTALTASNNTNHYFPDLCTINYYD
jgi:hypothetical protein